MHMDTTEASGSDGPNHIDKEPPIVLNDDNVVDSDLKKKDHGTSSIRERREKLLADIKELKRLISEAKESRLAGMKRHQTQELKQKTLKGKKIETEPPPFISQNDEPGPSVVSYHDALTNQNGAIDTDLTKKNFGPKHIHETIKG